MQMKTIKISNVTHAELSELQLQTQLYQAAVQTNFTRSEKFDLLDSIIALDISLKLWYAMRTRLEKPEPKKGFTIQFKPAESAVLFKICRAEFDNTPDYRLNVIRKYRAEIDRQLKSIL